MNISLPSSSNVCARYAVVPLNGNLEAEQFQLHVGQMGYKPLFFASIRDIAETLTDNIEEEQKPLETVVKQEEDEEYIQEASTPPPASPPPTTKKLPITSITLSIHEGLGHMRETVIPVRQVKKSRTPPRRVAYRISEAEQLVQSRKEQLNVDEKDHIMEPSFHNSPAPSGVGVASIPSTRGQHRTDPYGHPTPNSNRPLTMGEYRKLERAKMMGQPVEMGEVSYEVCVLCENKIMNTRSSNLMNHVRRHATLKQFSCPHCPYEHNEMAKVRMHMSHCHRDNDGVPRDHLCPEMQKQWDLLMKECFPKVVSSDFSFTEPTKMRPALLETVEKARAAMAMSKLHAKPSTSLRHIQPQTRKEIACDEIVKMEDGSLKMGCIECGEAVDSTKLVFHLLMRHRMSLIPYRCPVCSFFVSAYKPKTIAHIKEKHPESRDMPIGMSSGNHPRLFLKRFFVSYKGQADMPKFDRECELMGIKYVLPKDYDFVKKEVEKAQPADFVCEEVGFERLARVKPATCHYCKKEVECPGPSIMPLLAHAKRHFSKKQYHCVVCSYQSSEPSHVRKHHFNAHLMLDSPIDMSSKALREAWMKLMRQSFPTLRERIDKFQWTPLMLNPLTPYAETNRERVHPNLDEEINVEQ